MGYSSQGCKESDMTEWLNFTFSLSSQSRKNAQLWLYLVVEGPAQGGAMPTLTHVANGAHSAANQVSLGDLHGQAQVRNSNVA